MVERETTLEEFNRYCMNCKALYRCDTKTDGTFDCQEPFERSKGVKKNCRICGREYEHLPHYGDPVCESCWKEIYL